MSLWWMVVGRHGCNSYELSKTLIWMQSDIRFQWLSFSRRGGENNNLACLLWHRWLIDLRDSIRAAIAGCGLRSSSRPALIWANMSYSRSQPAYKAPRSCLYPLETKFLWCLEPGRLLYNLCYRLSAAAVPQTATHRELGVTRSCCGLSKRPRTSCESWRDWYM